MSATVVSVMVDKGVLPETKRKSSAGKPRTLAKAALKMGQRATPKGRSRVGGPYSSQLGWATIVAGES